MPKLCTRLRPVIVPILHVLGWGLWKSAPATDTTLVDIVRWRCTMCAFNPHGDWKWRILHRIVGFSTADWGRSLPKSRTNKGAIT
jgi:hypothetical protein